MLLLTFRIGNDRYALDTRDVIEVLPLIRSKRIPQTAAGLEGVMNYRGTPIPVIDLCAAMLGSPSAERMNTRIIIVRCTMESNQPRVFALKAEHLTETLRREESDFAAAGVRPDGVAYLGPVTMEGAEVIQRVEAAQLIPESVFQQLQNGSDNGNQGIA